MAALNFRFTADDTTVIDNLNRTERDAVRVWQTLTTYTFEFHDGHDTGNPIYFRATGNAEKKNLPKIDTLNCTAASYYGTAGGKSTGVVSVNAFRNGAKLAAALNAASAQEIQNVVSTSWASIALLAQRYWTNTSPPQTADEIAAASALAAPADKACSVPLCTGRVPVVGSGKAACSVCFKFQ